MEEQTKYESNNLATWEKLSRPPKTALKAIAAGRLKGKTDINPQWRYKAMTEAFGPCGVGWKYEIKRTWTEPVTDGQVAAFADIDLYTKVGTGADQGGGVWSAPIPGTGGSMLVAQEKSGLHSSDEAFKMAVTDALSVAMKMLGVAAEIYLGNWDGSKYLNAPIDEERIKEKFDQWMTALNDVYEAGSSNDIVEWWKQNGPKIKEDIPKASAAEVYKQVCDYKKKLEGLEAQKGGGGEN
jgi:hypothetical protein